MMHAMNERQGNTPPTWLGRSSWSLLLDVVGGWRQNRDKAVELLRFGSALLRPSVVRTRLTRLQDLGHCDVVPTLAQLLVASRHQLSFSLGADTKAEYGTPASYGLKQTPKYLQEKSQVYHYDLW